VIRTEHFFTSTEFSYGEQVMLEREGCEMEQENINQHTGYKKQRAAGWRRQESRKT
jgi:hypothetical protein